MNDDIALASSAAESMRSSITRYFERLLPKEQGLAVHCEIDACSPAGDDASLRCPIRFSLGDGTMIKGSYSLRHIGGNMYDAEVSVGDSEERFSLSLPEPEAARDDAYAARICSYLLEQLKRAAGEQLLRRESSDDDASS